MCSQINSYAQSHYVAFVLGHVRPPLWMSTEDMLKTALLARCSKGRCYLYEKSQLLWERIHSCWYLKSNFVPRLVTHTSVWTETSWWLLFRKGEPQPFLKSAASLLCLRRLRPNVSKRVSWARLAAKLRLGLYLALVETMPLTAKNEKDTSRREWTNIIF